MSICQSSALERPHFEFSFGRPPPKKKKRWRPCSVSRERQQGCKGCAAQALGEAEKQMRELGLLSLEERRPGDYCSLWLSQRRL